MTYPDDPLKQGLWLAERGMFVHPLDHPEHAKCRGLHGPKNPCDGTRGKHPSTKWGSASSNDPEEIVTWTAGQMVNLGIDCGKSNLLVIDEDAEGELRRYLDTVGQPMPDTFTVQTGKGAHYYFRQPATETFGNQEGALQDYSINIRGTGGFVVAPGSVHATGTLYTLINPDTPIRPVPDWLLAALRPAKRQQEKPRTTPGGSNASLGTDKHRGPIPAGKRHGALVSYAGRLRARGLDRHEALVLMERRWQECEQPAGEREVSWTEAMATVDDVWSRYAPNDPQAEADVEEDIPVRRIKLTAASEIEPEPVIWAWEREQGEGRIPAGALTLAAGREGTGKSSFGIWLAARLSRGELPGTFYGHAKNVMYAAVEDSWTRTLVPRLMAAGADLTRVFRVDAEDVLRGETMISLPLDVHLIEQAINENDVAALIVDPLMSTLGTSTDAHRTQDVRQALEPLVRMAERTKALTLGIAHFSKASGTDASQLISGSGAFKDLARAILAFARDRDSDEQVMTQTKNSLGRLLDMPSLGYQIEGVDVPTPKGTANVGRLTFTGPTERSVEDTLTAQGGEGAAERDEAVEWLVTFLSDPKNGGECAANELLKAGERDGFSRDTLKRTKKRAGVESRKAGGTGAGWVWAFVGANTEGEDETAKGAKGAKGARTREPAPFAPLDENPLPSGSDPLPRSLSVVNDERPKTPCAECGRDQWNAENSPLCGACRTAA